MPLLFNELVFDETVYGGLHGSEVNQQNQLVGADQQANTAILAYVRLAIPERPLPAANMVVVARTLPLDDSLPQSDRASIPAGLRVDIGRARF